MGLFDTIKCEAPLPAELSTGELKGHDWIKEEFQTKSLQQALGYFVIKKDKELYEERTANGLLPLNFWDLDSVDDTNSVSMPCYYHGVIDFYANIYKEKYDYSVELRAVFSEGKLTDLLLTELEEESNSGRLIKEAAWRERIEKRRILESKWWHKVYIFIYLPFRQQDF